MTDRQHGRQKLADERWRIIQDASAQGRTRDEAAQLAGMKLAGLKNLIYKQTGSTTWPVEEG